MRRLVATAVLLCAVVPLDASTAPAPLPTGALAQLPGSAGCLATPGRRGCTDAPRLGTPHALAVAPDGRHLYVGTGFDRSSKLIVFRRQQTGALTQVLGRDGCVKHSEIPAGCTPGGRLNRPFTLAVSPDGRQVLTHNHLAGLLLAYDRNARTGALRLAAQLDARTADSSYHVSITFSSDGRSVYVASPASARPGILIYRREPRTGVIERVPGPAGCVERAGMGGGCTAAPAAAFFPRAVAVSPDGAHLYAASDGAVFAFARDTASGALAPLPGAAGCTGSLGGEPACAAGSALERAASIVASPDGRHVYTAGTRLAAFARAPGGELAQLRPPACAGAPCTGTAGPIHLAPDGRTAYVLRHGAVLALARDARTGHLRQLAGRYGCYGASRGCTPLRGGPAPSALAFSLNGSSVYAGGLSLMAFRRAG